MSETGLREPNRRTVSKGIAWSVPVVAMAAAAPAQAASTSKCVTLFPPTGNNAPCVTDGQNHPTITKVDYGNSGSGVTGRIVTTYLRFAVPDGLDLVSGDKITFSYTLGNATIASTPAPTVTASPAGFTYGTSVATAGTASTITVTATAGTAGVTGDSSKLYSIALKFEIPVSSLNDTSFVLSSTSTAGNSCSTATYSTSITIAGAQGTVVLTGNPCDAQKIRYYYVA